MSTQVLPKPPETESSTAIVTPAPRKTRWALIGSIAGILASFAIGAGIMAASQDTVVVEKPVAQPTQVAQPTEAPTYDHQTPNEVVEPVTPDPIEVGPTPAEAHAAAVPFLKAAAADMKALGNAAGPAEMARYIDSAASNIEKAADEIRPVDPVEANKLDSVAYHYHNAATHLRDGQYQLALREMKTGLHGLTSVANTYDV